MQAWPCTAPGQGGLSTLHHMPLHSHKTLPMPPRPAGDAWRNSLAVLSQRLQGELGLALGTELAGEPVPDPRWVAINHDLASQLGWDSQAWGDEALQVFSGNALWPGMRPLATVYSGHQFGQWAGQLGDGRALLLGEVDTPMGAQELQLKGAGPTPYSRRGDGRAVLRSSIREYLCSEAMHGLGIPTTRALCLSASPLGVRRETVETAAVVTRVAPSFLRFGHFEHFAHSRRVGTHQALQALVDFVVHHHLPLVQDAPNRALALLAEVVTRTAHLMVDWQSVGFCHGVMNTDNMSILGLTIDYGPFGFLDAFDPDHICNHSDDRGRYAWGRQPQIAYWNLQALAQALAPLVPNAEVQPQQIIDQLTPFETIFTQAMRRRWLDKLGLRGEQAGDAQLVQDWLQLMAQGRVDFTIAFRRLAQLRCHPRPGAPESSDAPDALHAHTAPVRDLFLDRPAFDAWADRYLARLRQEGSVDAERAERMNRINPLYVLRNHMAEQAIRQAQAGDDSEVQRLQRLLSRPFEAQPGCEADADFPPAWAQSIEVSCSS